MSDSPSNAPRCIACSVFEKELNALAQDSELDLRVTTLDSMLHMHPARLQEELERILEEELGCRTILLYGDCHPGMADMESARGIARSPGLNCCEIFLGTERYRRLRAEGAFFLLPEWTERWEEVFSEQLGLSSEAARQFMQEMHTKLVYVDTGQKPVPENVLQRISESFSLPWEVLTITLEELRSAIRAAVERLTADAT